MRGAICGENQLALFPDTSTDFYAMEQWAQKFGLGDGDWGPEVRNIIRFEVIRRANGIWLQPLPPTDSAL